MNTNRIMRLISTYAAPAAMILAALVLIFSPDTATALVCTVIGYAAAAIGALLLLSGLGSRQLKATIQGAIAVAVGLWLKRNPLSIAVVLGKLLGLGLLFGAVSGYRRSASAGGRGLYLAEGLMGVILLLAPLTASRLLYTAVGVLLLVAGIAMLLSRSRNKRLGRGLDDIIDL